MCSYCLTRCSHDLLALQDYWTERVRTSDAQHLCPGTKHTLVDLWNDAAPGLGLNNSAEQCGGGGKQQQGDFDPEQLNNDDSVDDDDSDGSGGGGDSDPENPIIGNCSAVAITTGVCLLHATPILKSLHNTTNPGVCCTACRADPRCVAWNTNTGASGAHAGCYLRTTGRPVGPSDPACNGMGIMRGEPPPRPQKPNLPYPRLPSGEPNPACTYEDDLFLARVKQTIKAHDPATPLFCKPRAARVPS